MILNSLRGHIAAKLFILFSVVSSLFFAVWGAIHPYALWGFAFLIPIIGIGIKDMSQTSHAIRKNFPVLGNLRYLFEKIRPEINQYFVESNLDGRPFSREERSVVYQRAKGVTDTVPFGTQQNVYDVNFEWINHSVAPKPIPEQEPRVMIGGKNCTKPYSASLFNVSAMSYGSLSKNAVYSLNQGARYAHFYQNTGEGGLTPYHLEKGGDICWQIGTGYFGCRTADGNFSDEEFSKKAVLPQVKMIEIKLSQGAKPGHGGILPAAKVTAEIAEIRGVETGKDVLSPPWHTAFVSPEGLLHFVQRLRELSGGKPVGFKLCLGKKREFLAIIKAMLKTGIKPDFITVDGAEGGTGAAPLEFSNSVGTPLNEGLSFVNQSLIAAGVRDEIKIIASGRILTGFNLIQKIALGADLCNSARGMLFAIGCIQALKCNTNTCPTGIATQDPELMKGLDVGDKSQRVARFHRSTVHSFMEVLCAAGLNDPSELKPWHIHRRVTATDVKNYSELFGEVEPGSLLTAHPPASMIRAWNQATAETWDSVQVTEAWVQRNSI